MSNLQARKGGSERGRGCLKVRLYNIDKKEDRNTARGRKSLGGPGEDKGP